MIKGEIEQLINGYKDDFYNATGLQLIAVPDVALPKFSFYDLIALINVYFDLKADILLPGNRNRGIAKAKEMLVTIADKMGYTDREISTMMQLPRAGMIDLRNAWKGKMAIDDNYRYDFYKVLEYVYNNRPELHNKIIDMEQNWEKRVEKYDSMFNI